MISFTVLQSKKNKLLDILLFLSKSLQTEPETS